MPSRVVLGRIAGAHALRGEVRVQYFGDGPENLLGQTFVWLGEGTEDEQARRYELRSRGQGRAGEVRLGLAGIGDRDAAEGLRGTLVMGDAAALPDLEEGEFYWHELVGCRVEGRDGRFVGTVQEIWETGAHDVLVVRAQDGRRHLLSTARELMPEVDVSAGRIVVEFLPGMLGEDAPSDGGADG